MTPRFNESIWIRAVWTDICSRFVKTPPRLQVFAGIISQRFVFPLHARYRRVEFLFSATYSRMGGSHRRRSRLLPISIANQPRRICSLKRWSIDSASLRPYLAACSARDWLLRRWRCIIKIKIGYCPGSIVGRLL